MRSRLRASSPSCLVDTISATSASVRPPERRSPCAPAPLPPAASLAACNAASASPATGAATAASPAAGAAVAAAAAGVRRSRPAAP
jgi:hypothetical protein